MPGMQRGQAIVLIALMLTVLVGMAALAIDGARAYAVRRDLQAAVDSAALAAGDSLQQTGSYTSAEQAATSNFGLNMRLYGAPSCSPAYGSPGALPYTVTCTYGDGTSLKQVVSFLGPQGNQFTLSATRSMQPQFARILTNGANVTLGGSAAGGVNNLLYTPTVGAVDQAGCGGAAGTAVSIAGSGTLSITGDLVSTGAISVSGVALKVAGDIYAHCQSSVPGSVTTACYPSGASTPCSYPDVAGATRSGYRFVDPNYPPPALAGGSQPSPANDVVLSPGSFSFNPAIAAQKCYFLSGGVYRWNGGYTNNGGFVSNELKPPDEPNPSNDTLLANHQFWNTDGVNCAGSFKLTVTGGSGWSVGTYGFELTSVRTDVYAGTSYQRESAPSRCQSVTLSSGQVIELQVSNVPGATSYNIYMSRSGCTTPFGMVYNLAVSGSVQNVDTSGCPFGTGTNCTLGQESVTAPAFALSSLPLPNAFAPPGTAGAYPPDGETAALQSTLPNQNPPRAASPAGDRANENQCDTTGAALASCPDAVTPGAVVFHIPGAALNATSGGDNFVFSGYQYNWIVVYEPGKTHPPANGSSNTIGAAGNSAFVGLVYMPYATLGVQGGAAFSARGTGGIIADTITFSGQLPTITYSPNYSPQHPPTRLIA